LPVARRIVAGSDLFYDDAPGGGLEFPERFGSICAQRTPSLRRANKRPEARALSAQYPPIGGIRLEARMRQTRGGMRSRFLLALTGFVLSSCDGAPSRNILGSYFPSWMVCALAGIAAAVIGRSILKATGLLEEVPAPLAVLLAIACAVTFGLWLLWLA
jgi:YtcA family